MEFVSVSEGEGGGLHQLIHLWVVVGEEEQVEEEEGEEESLTYILERLGLLDS